MTGMAGRLHSVEDKVMFRNGSDDLAGLLILPEGPGPHPATVFIHGSGAAARDGFRHYPSIWEELSRHGVASLAWDKPGVGGSTGDFTQQTFEDRASEGIAAIDYLKQRPDIDRTKVGLWGISQAGWVMPQICEAVGDLAFVIGVGVPVCTPAEQDLFRVGHTLPADGYSDEETCLALAATEQVHELMRQDASFDTVFGSLSQYRGEKWFELVVGASDEASYRFGKGNLFFSPIRHLAAIRCPVLVLFGELDTLVDGEQSERVYSELLPKAGNHDVTVEFFPKANHSLKQAETGGQEEMRRLGQNDWEYAVGYLGRMNGWLAERGIARA